METLIRPRRLRQNPAIREMIRESSLKASQLIFPLFICEGKNKLIRHKQVPSLMTVSVDKLKNIVTEAYAVGVRSVVLFGVVDKKDSEGSKALDKKGPVVRAIQEIRSVCPEMQVATDIALDPYTSHGHDGLYEGGEVINDETVQVLCEMATLHAKAGAQIVSPSDMMDGRVAAIRQALDQEGFLKTVILSYTAKYASALYGPFRDTLNVSLQGDKKSYQMDPANRREALRELSLDLNEGADMVMVKPALWYLDVIADFKASSDVPVAAYFVSGEAALIEVGAKAGLFEKERALMESMLAIRRAGADLILSYHAVEVAKILQKSN